MYNCNLDGEQWITYLDFTDYLISNMGKIKYVPKNKVFVARPLTKPSVYRAVSLRKKGKSYVIRLHRLILLAFYGDPGPGMVACHNNGIIHDNRLSNLRWDTHKNNMRDKSEHGRLPHGEGHFNCKLTKENVWHIRSIKPHKGYIQKLAKYYKVNESTIRAIISGKTWKI